MQTKLATALRKLLTNGQDEDTLCEFISREVPVERAYFRDGVLIVQTEDSMTPFTVEISVKPG